MSVFVRKLRVTFSEPLTASPWVIHTEEIREPIEIVCCARVIVFVGPVTVLFEEGAEC